MKRSMIDGKRFGTLAMASGLLLSAAMAVAADADSAFSKWLGREITVGASHLSDQIPEGGKLTFVHDAREDVVRVCTRTTAEQSGAWSADMANGCNVTMTYSPGTRYCTLEDVKAGDGEVLASCHRLRTRDVALKSAGKGDVELKDMIVFLLSPDRDQGAIAILVDSPSRVTEGGVLVGKW